jgi:hypothetical protein
MERYHSTYYELVTKGCVMKEESERPRVTAEAVHSSSLLYQKYIEHAIVSCLVRFINQVAARISMPTIDDAKG